MTSERIKEIQQQTAYPDSVSVQQALLQVWNECSTSYQTEISDEEIEKAARDYDNGNIYGPPLVNFEQGAFWYREQLKQNL